MAILGGLIELHHSMAAGVARNLGSRHGGRSVPTSTTGSSLMHGTIMVFFVAMPFLLGAFGNFLIP